MSTDDVVPVLVIVARAQITTQSTRSWREICEAYTVCTDLGGARFPQEDEGITWCRGHKGPAADALRVACALWSCS